MASVDYSNTTHVFQFTGPISNDNLPIFLDTDHLIVVDMDSISLENVVGCMIHVTQKGMPFYFIKIQYYFEEDIGKVICFKDYREFLWALNLIKERCKNATFWVTRFVTDFDFDSLYFLFTEGYIAKEKELRNIRSEMMK